MKTQKEIEQLASVRCDTWGEACAFYDGYNQCQEDNKDKKYTYEDMRRAFFNGNVMRDIDEFNCFLTTI